MRTLLTLTRRELAGYFLSLTGYVIIAAAVFLVGFSFVVLMMKLQQDPTPMPITEMFYITQFFWLVLLLSAPAITMRLFALEKYSGTYETLMTTPVSDLQVVMSKFIAAMLFYLVMWLPLIGCILIVRQYTGEPGAFDVGTLVSTYIGILLLGGVYISIGCFASSLTRSQVTAAMVSLVLGASLFFVGFLGDQIPGISSWQAELFNSFALFEQMHDFARGIVDTRPVVLLTSLTVLFLFLTLRVVESRRWK
jgi:ABC-2 type transport system permease protein